MTDDNKRCTCGDDAMRPGAYNPSCPIDGIDVQGADLEPDPKDKWTVPMDLDRLLALSEIELSIEKKVKDLLLYKEELGCVPWDFLGPEIEID